MKNLILSSAVVLIASSAAQAQSDCNGNRVPDTEDIANGLLLDCNFDGVPDNCAESRNLILNGSFEAEATSWAVSGIDHFTYPSFQGVPSPMDCELSIWRAALVKVSLSRPFPRLPASAIDLDSH